MTDHSHDKPRSNEKPSEYSALAHLFVELRGRGLSMSANDFEFLRAFESQGVPPTVIAEVMLQLFEECQKEKRVFPASFAPIARRVKALLKLKREF